MKLKMAYSLYDEYKENYNEDEYKKNKEGSNNKKLKNNKMMRKEERVLI